MKRLFLNISTTAAVVLFTMAALDMLEKENYVMTGVFFLLAFWLPAQNERDTLVKRRFGLGTDTETDPKTGNGVGSEERNC